MRNYIIVAIVSIVLTVIVLHFIKKKAVTDGNKTGENFKAMAKTKEFKDFMLTPQGKALAKTPQFKKLAGDYFMQTIANLI